MNLTYLKKKGFKIVTNWQECNKNTIFLFDSNNDTKLIEYINLAIKKMKDGTISGSCILKC